jgi:Fic family protein
MIRLIMKRTELAAILQKVYQKGLTCGVEKVDQKSFSNIWFVVPPRPPETRPNKLPITAITKAHQLIEQLPRFEQTDDLDRLVAYLFVRREAIQSSRLEGTWSTIEHVFTPGELFDKKEGASERSSVLGYANILEKEIQNCQRFGPKVINEKLVCRIHKKIMGKDSHFRGQPGQIRESERENSVVFIGGAQRIENSIYNPTPPRHVSRCFKEILEWMSNDTLIEMGDAGMGLSLPLRMAIGHSHFEAVHPFSDGNGRVGRVLMMLQMACFGKLPLYLSGFIEQEKVAYGESLEHAQKKLNYLPIIEFICEAIIASYKDSEQTKVCIRGLPTQWVKRGDFREKSSAQRALSFIIKHPIFTVKQLQKELGVSTPAANRAAELLSKAKIVRERTGFGRNRVFAAEEVIELLSRNFGEAPTGALEKAKSLLKR